MITAATRKKWKETEKLISTAEADYMLMGKPLHKPKINNELFKLPYPVTDELLKMGNRGNHFVYEPTAEIVHFEDGVFKTSNKQQIEALTKRPFNADDNKPGPTWELPDGRQVKISEIKKYFKR